MRRWKKWPALPPQAKVGRKMLWKGLNLGVEGGIMGNFLVLGGDSLRKILYQANHMLKKVKSAQKKCQHVQICPSVVFSRQPKNTTDQQTDR